MIEYSAQVNAMCPITKGPKHGPAPIPEAVSYTHLVVDDFLRGLIGSGFGGVGGHQAAVYLSLIHI